MKKVSLFGKRLFVVFGLCVLLAGVLLTGYKPAKATDSADLDNPIEISYKECENDNEQILYEDVDETISLQVIGLQDEDKSYEVSDEASLTDGYYRQITMEDGYTVVAGVMIDGKNYVVKMDSAEPMTEEDVENEIENLFQDKIIIS